MESRNNNLIIQDETMKLTKGTKPTEHVIPFGISYIRETTENYTEITLTDITEIAKLKSKGFKSK